MKDLQELQKLTINRKDYIDFSNPNDIDLMGDQLLITKLDHSWGAPLPTIYYDGGLEQFDRLLSGSKDFELQVSFHMACFLNAIIFILYHPDYGIISKVGIWRHRLDKHETFENKDVIVIKEDRTINMIKSGIFGEGMTGVVASVAVGSLLKKIAGIKSKTTEGVEYKLYYKDPFDNDCWINIHSENRHKYETSMFILAAFPEIENSTGLELNKKQCYIATVCYGNIDCEEVKLFRWYRDNFLNRSWFGRVIIKVYYKASPSLSKYLNNHSFLSSFIKNNILDKLLMGINQKKRSFCYNMK